MNVITSPVKRIAKSEELRANSKELRANSKEQRANSKEQRAKSKEQRAKSNTLCYKPYAAVGGRLHLGIKGCIIRG